MYLALAKHISGNNANTDEYFKFRIDFENATVGDVFTISGQDATVTYKGETIATQTRFVVGEENYIYLKGGQEALIGRDDDYNNEEIPIGLRYTITELDAEDYNTYKGMVNTGVVVTYGLYAGKEVDLWEPLKLTDLELTEDKWEFTVLALNEIIYVRENKNV